MEESRGTKDQHKDRVRYVEELPLNQRVGNRHQLVDTEYAHHAKEAQNAEKCKTIVTPASTHKGDEHR